MAVEQVANSDINQNAPISDGEIISPKKPTVIGAVLCALFAAAIALSVLASGLSLVVDSDKPVAGMYFYTASENSVNAGLSIGDVVVVHPKTIYADNAIVMTSGDAEVSSPFVSIIADRGGEYVVAMDPDFGNVQFERTSIIGEKVGSLSGAYPLVDIAVSPVGYVFLAFLPFILLVILESVRIDRKRKLRIANDGDVVHSVTRPIVSETAGITAADDSAVKAEVDKLKERLDAKKKRDFEQRRKKTESARQDTARFATVQGVSPVQPEVSGVYQNNVFGAQPYQYDAQYYTSPQPIVQPDAIYGTPSAYSQPEQSAQFVGGNDQYQQIQYSSAPSYSAQPVYAEQIETSPQIQYTEPQPQYSAEPQYAASQVQYPSQPQYSAEPQYAEPQAQYTEPQIQRPQPSYHTQGYANPQNAGQAGGYSQYAPGNFNMPMYPQGGMPFGAQSAMYGSFGQQFPFMYGNAASQQSFMQPPVISPYLMNYQARTPYWQPQNGFGLPYMTGQYRNPFGMYSFGMPYFGTRI